MEYVFQSLNRSHDVTSIKKCQFVNHVFRTSNALIAEQVRGLMKRSVKQEIWEITPKTYEEERKADIGDTVTTVKLEPERKKTGRPKLNFGTKVVSGARSSTLQETASSGHAPKGQEGGS